jgi:hypothetical protein
MILPVVYMDMMLLLTLREEHGFRVLHTYIHIHTLHSMDPELVNMTVGCGISHSYKNIYTLQLKSFISAYTISESMYSTSKIFLGTYKGKKVKLSPCLTN